jgi:hypothetical protein
MESDRDKTQTVSSPMAEVFNIEQTGEDTDLYCLTFTTKPPVPRGAR